MTATRDTAPHDHGGGGERHGDHSHQRVGRISPGGPEDPVMAGRARPIAPVAGRRGRRGRRRQRPPPRESRADRRRPRRPPGTIEPPPLPSTTCRRRARRSPPRAGPGIGCPCPDLGGQAQHDATRIARVNVACDVPGPLHALNQPRRSPRGQLQPHAELARCRLAPARQVLHGEHLVVGHTESPRERRALSGVGERLTQQGRADQRGRLRRDGHRVRLPVGLARASGRRRPRPRARPARRRRRRHDRVVSPVRARRERRPVRRRGQRSQAFRTGTRRRRWRSRGSGSSWRRARCRAAP